MKSPFLALVFLGFTTTLPNSAQTAEKPAPAADTPSSESAAVPCNLNVDSWAGGNSDRTYGTSFMESVITVRVRLSPETCTWRIDGSGKPSWISLRVIEGNYVGNGYYRGAATVDIEVSKNTGYGRSGRFHFTTSSFANPVDVNQSNFRGACVFNPVGTAGSTSRETAPGFISIVQNMTAPSNNFLAHIVDRSTCSLSPRFQYFTFGMNGTAVQREATPPRGYLIRRPGVQANLKGEGALLALSDPGLATANGTLSLELPVLANLPADLRITRQTLSKNLIVFGDGGGVVRVTGSVTRPKTNPARPCAFLPEHYQVMPAVSTGGWLNVTTESGCAAGKPDNGTLVITALPNNSSSRRVGAIFTAWGTVIFVVVN